MESLSRDAVGTALEIVSSDLARVESIITRASQGSTPFFSESTNYLTRAGGKRIRPALVVLASMMGSGPSAEIHSIAAAVEMTHVATLYHDDVIDEAEVRHGVLSANEKWGNTVAILAGDFLLARASTLAARVGGEIGAILAETVTRIVEGQVRELAADFDPKRTSEHYFSTLKDKTVAIYETSARIGAMLGECSEEVIDGLTSFGHAFGMAFQVADDLLDLSATQEDIGKPPGTDLRVGVYTLPVILAAEAEPRLYALLVRDPDVEAIREIVRDSGGFDRALDVAADYAKQALEILEQMQPTGARASLEQLTRLVVDRVPELRV